jgi:TonB family protein
MIIVLALLTTAFALSDDDRDPAPEQEDSAVEQAESQPMDAVDAATPGGAEPEPPQFQAPEPLFLPPPTYPEAALAEGVSGSVLLQLDIATDGSIGAVKVLEADRDDFERAAVINARSFRFSPALSADGSAATFQIQYRTVFEATAAAPVCLEGRVREAGPRVPLSNAEILVVSTSGERIVTRTDEQGRYQLAGLTPGEWSIAVSASGHVTDTLSVDIKDGKASTVDSYLIRDEVRTGTRVDEELVITALAPETEVTERTLSAEDVRYLPGSGGDVVKVVQNLPGIARAPLGTGNLRIRGTAPEDSLYFLDGGQIPIVFHFAGLTTVLSSDLLEEVGYLPGSYTVRYGRALGGLVDLRTQRSLPERSNGYISVDVFQAAAYAEQRIGKHDAVTISARRSYADAVLNPILNKGELTVQAPRYYDAQARWSRKLDNGWNDIIFLLSDDRFRFLGQGDDEVVLAGFATQFQKVRWLHVRNYGDGLELEASAVAGPEKKFFENDGTSEAYEEELRVATRLQLKQSIGIDRHVGWVIGIDPNFNRSSFLYDIARPPERTVSSSRTAPKESGDFNIWQPSLYGEMTLRWSSLTVFPGVRADVQAVDDTTVTSIDPRLRALWAVGEKTTLKAGAGRHSQAPTPRQLSLTSDGNPDLGPERAYQYSAGIKQSINSWLSVDLTGFYHHLDDLVSGQEDRFSFYSGPPPTGPFDTDPYANDGTGRTYGLEFLANVSTDNTTGFLSATLSHSDRIKRPGDDRTLFPYDQPLVLNALVSQKLPKRWRIGTRVRYGSGNPYTPVQNRIYNHDRREFIPVYGERDSGRLPPFFSLDLRIDKDYVFKNWTLTTYLDIQNATYAKNVETQGYSYDYREEEPTLSSPPLPAFGLRGEW